MVQIVADTTAGLPLEFFKERNIPVIPQIVIFDEQSYRDDTELDTATFLQKLRASPQLPKTAAPPPALYNPVYEKYISRGESIIVVAPSAKVSGTVRAATVAAQDFPGADIRVVDTLTVAGNLATMVLMADQWAKEGQDADRIVSGLNELTRRQHTYFLVATLEYLKKGGRIGGAKALLGEMLQVKPILTIRDGQVEPYEQQRTKRKAIARMVEILLEQCKPGPDMHICVMHADAEEDARELVADIQQRIAIPAIPIYLLPPAIVVHVGPGTMGIGFFT